jgi:asparagine synthase (glutamine-hydrolysing)
MCGICGKLTSNGILVDDALIRRMASVIRHRGPDDEGIYISPAGEKMHNRLCVGLGHRRLSIIDLSEAGRQPMSNEDQSVWLVFNGEIYNFIALRRELESRGHRFSSQTDSETIIHLYEEDGIAAVKKLVGMFAFAIWDERKQILFMARDPIGIKPLVYSRDERSLTFASEIKSILQDPGVRRDLDWDALGLYLTLNYIPAPYTIFKGIRKLKPGHILVWENGDIREEAYWNIGVTASSDNEIGNELQSLKRALFNSLDEAVHMQMIADVPVGAFLSGGIDSSIIVGLMARHSNRPVKTYSIGYSDMPMFDETGYARDVASFNQTDHHEIKLTAKDIIFAIPEVLESFDEPFGDSSALPTFIVSRETGRDVKVALSGDGGDELFAGYRMYKGEAWFSKYRRIPLLIRKQIIEPFFLALPDSRDMTIAEYIRRAKKFFRGAKDSFEDRFFAWNELFPTDLRRDLLNNSGEFDHDLGMEILSRRLNERKDDHINRMLYVDLKESLPGDMLRKVDAMSMAHSLEVRVPLLDQRVCEIAFSMAGDWKLRNGKSKYILMETFKDILPSSLHKRPKWGFEIPISNWLKSDLQYLINENLSEERIKKQAIFHYPTIKRLIDDLMSNRSDTSWQLWNLIVFQAWYSQYAKN